MRNRSEKWQRIAARGDFLMESVAVINNVEYSSITAPIITHGLMSGNTLSVGNCIAGTLKFSILTTDAIPKSAEIVIKARITDEAGYRAWQNETMTKDEAYTEWLEFGHYWIDRRTINDDLITLECYDAMLKGNQPYEDDQPGMNWPKSMQTVLERIAVQMGVQIDARTVINSGSNYIVYLPTEEMTLLDILGFIGSAHGGNWTITPEGKLRLVPLVAPPDESFNIIDESHNIIYTPDGYRLVWHMGGREESVLHPAGGGLLNVPIVTKSIQIARPYAISKVTMHLDSSHAYTAGTSTGFELEIKNNPSASQAICNDLLTALQGMGYAPFSISGACFDPAAELGDWIIVGDQVRSVMYNETQTLDIAYLADVSAPGEDEIASEYPYKSALFKTTYKIEALQDTVDAHSTRITQNANAIALEVVHNDRVIAAINASNEMDGSSAIQIRADKVNLTGYATFTSLSGNGTSVINGGNITTGTLNANLIKVGTLQAENTNNRWNMATGDFVLQGVNSDTPAIQASGNGNVVINATNITTGTLSADRIRTGILQAPDNSNNFWNLNNGTFQLKSTGADHAAISVSSQGIVQINANNIRAGRIQSISNSNNYWDLDTGVFQIKATGADTAAISVSSSGNVQINATAIKTGRIQSASGTRNQWNLDTGDFVLQGADAQNPAISASGSGNVVINATNITTGNLSADRIRTGKIQATGNSNNFWDLDNGTFQLKSTGASAAAISVNSNGVVSINADNIRAGKLQAVGNNDNYWDLTNGTFQLKSSGANSAAISLNAQGVVSINADNLTVGEIRSTSGHRDNYWNLTTGDFQIKASSDTNAAISISNNRTIINATNITTGTLSADLIRAGTLQASGNSNNYWNLDTGAFQLKSTGASTAALSVSSSGVVAINADYITSGKISAANGRSYFDLDNSIIHSENNLGGNYRKTVTIGDGVITVGSGSIDYDTGNLRLNGNVAVSGGLFATSSGITIYGGVRIGDYAGASTTVTRDVTVGNVRLSFVYGLLCAVTSTGGGGVSGDFEIVTSPANVSVTDGGQAVFEVVTNKAIASATWYCEKNSTTTIVTTGVTSPTTASSRLTISNVSLSDNGNLYSVVVTDSSDNLIETFQVTLTVTANAIVLTGPANESVTAPADATFWVSVTNAVIATAQWQYSTNGTTWANSSDMYSIAYDGSYTYVNIDPTSTSMNGWQYRVVITTTDNMTATSQAATLSVIAAPSVTLYGPSDITRSVNDSATFEVEISGATIVSADWEEYINGTWYSSALTSSITANGTKVSTTFWPVTASLNGHKYRAIIECSDGVTRTSNAATLTVT